MTIGRLLQGRLPYSYVGPSVPTSVYNRAIRLLEINLNAFNPVNTPAFTSANRDLFQFTSGDVIWNLTENVLQMWDGYKWVNITTPEPNKGLQAQGEIGTVQIILDGSLTVEVGIMPRTAENPIKKTTKGKGANYRPTSKGAGMTEKGVKEYRKKESR
jgi:hypothetical protein